MVLELSEKVHVFVLVCSYVFLHMFETFVLYSSTCVFVFVRLYVCVFVHESSLYACLNRSYGTRLRVFVCLRVCMFVCLYTCLLCMHV